MAKATVAPKTEPKKPAPKMGVNKWDDELAAMAGEAVATEANSGGGSFVGTRGGHFTVNGSEVPGDKMRVVVVDHVLENCYYKGKFDAKNPTSPVCYAFGRTEEEMVPHANSSEPQCESCKDCPMNQFGSADTGRGKACKNTRRLALLAEDDLEDVENASTAVLKVPPTSIKFWAGYVKQIASVLKRPPLGVITEASIEQNDDTQIKLGFKLAEQITDGATLGALMTKRVAVESDLFAPYPAPAEEEAPKKAAGKNKFAGKAEAKAPAKKATTRR